MWVIPVKLRAVPQTVPAMSPRRPTVVKNVQVTKHYDVVGIGHALVDVLAPVDEQFLVDQGLVRGTMHLIDEARADSLYEAMGASREVSGGCAASTVVGAIACGGTGAFMGTIADDRLGESFTADLMKAGVEARTQIRDEVGTGRSLILISSDGERTMNTFLGAAASVGPAVEDDDLLREAKIVFIEAYVLDSLYTAESLIALGERVRSFGAKLAISLSDPFCVERHRDALLEFLEKGADICIGNEQEIRALFNTHDVDDGLAAAIAMCDVVSVTCGSRGSIVASENERHHVDAVTVDVVDTTGAGDVYASGFLYGLSQGWDLQRAGRMGSAAAAAVITRVGARVESPITEPSLAEPSLAEPHSN